MLKTVNALLPARGRIAETLALIPRLNKAAEYPFELTVIVDADSELRRALTGCVSKESLLFNPTRLGYWKSLRLAAQKTNGNFIVTLANDLLPGCGWLKRAIEAHTRTFNGHEGLMGFNDGVHFGEHAAHFLINRSMLYRWYGNDYFPVIYDHTYGDAEMSRRAQEEHKFAVANFAILFHNHPYNGKATDSVYAEGQVKTEADKALWYKRMANRWT